MLTLYLSLIETPQDKTLFEQVYYTYRKQMYFVAKSILEDNFLAEDAVQEAFLGIAKQIMLLRDMPERHRKLYVLTAAKNAAINLYKKEDKYKNNYAGYDKVNMDYLSDETMNTQISRENCQTILAVISELSPFQRDILTMRYANNWNCVQIAVALGRKPATVRKELSRARRALRDGCRTEGLDIED